MRVIDGEELEHNKNCSNFWWSESSGGLEELNHVVWRGLKAICHKGTEKPLFQIINITKGVLKG